MPKQTLGDRIALIREELKKSQTDFALLLNYSDPATVSKWESNDRKPDIRTLQKIAEIGNKDLGWLITGKIATTGEEAFKSTFYYSDKKENPYLKRIQDLEEENKKLKKKLAVYEKAVSYFDKAKETNEEKP